MRIHSTVGMAATAAALVLSVSPAAAAAELRDWQGVNPLHTLCNQDAVTVASAVIAFDGHRLGTIELRRSNTCRTAWARLHNDLDHLPGDAHDGYATVTRDSDGVGFDCSSPEGADTVCWTDMVDESATTAHAYGNIDPYPSFGYGHAEARTPSV